MWVCHIPPPCSGHIQLRLYLPLECGRDRPLIAPIIRRKALPHHCVNRVEVALFIVNLQAFDSQCRMPKCICFHTCRHPGTPGTFFARHCQSAVDRKSANRFREPRHIRAGSRVLGRRGQSRQARQPGRCPVDDSSHHCSLHYFCEPLLNRQRSCACAAEDTRLRGRREAALVFFSYIYCSHGWYSSRNET